MRSFLCACGSTVYFENTQCLHCGGALAFDPAQLAMRRVEAEDRLCAHHATFGTCNWLVSADHACVCASCALNETVPDLADPRRLALYASVEKAKRRLLFILYALGLPVEGRAVRDDGLAFRILADARLDGDGMVDVPEDAVMTGHAEGCITINLMEADPPWRERVRAAMNEPYRTLLGHFRHESGHYYWRRLLANGPLDAFRSRFGDERQPYDESLQAHYSAGPPQGWSNAYVCAYAACHPLEDFAESWAHYLHMVDTLQTAATSDISIAGGALRNPLDSSAADRRGSSLDAPPFSAADFDGMVADWRVLAEAMNNLNRSMGLDDAYPFALPPQVVEKLRFVHELVRAAKGAA